MTTTVPPFSRGRGPVKSTLCEWFSSLRDPVLDTTEANVFGQPTEHGEWRTLLEIGPPAPKFLFSLQVPHATEMGVRDRGLDDRRSSDDLSRTAGIV